MYGTMHLCVIITVMSLHFHLLSLYFFTPTFHGTPVPFIAPFFLSSSGAVSSALSSSWIVRSHQSEPRVVIVIDQISENLYC